ncbi:hypothetical protein DB35_11740 [Streptomyces abyssalis]|uniref:DUF2620 domain-containing protein n=1 Tax=Streptomyces abyssalis TaxID=933944 RepID=A0A1E7JHE1_9ACTN|nr:DUF2620 domain-containing protein [Streptomyces abyssalis]OEU85879.1 hypothetical protein AN215_26190 [Streptomyces abyssalis]OEU92656.1 hypothetical protein DB35_11740 [Streptomyces abyssalis]OEV29186.1 hypothetical protein AN219_17780 [Streptomyces nanshensis]
MTRILTGGVGKVQVAEALADLAVDGLEVTVSGDMEAAMKLRTGQADYYLGTCHTGAGASLGVLLGVLGSGTCHTFGRGVPTEAEVTELLEGGTKVFGFGMDQISEATPVIARAIAAHTRRPPDPRSAP